MVLSCLLVYSLRRQLCASCSATATTVLPVVLRSLSAVCHPVGFHPLTFRARLFRLRRARSAYLAILYHYSYFHNYLMISVTYNLSDNGILSTDTDTQSNFNPNEYIHLQDKI